MTVMKFIFSMILSFMPGLVNLFWLPSGVGTEWYASLAKFPFTPEIHVFSFLWAAVHVLLGIGLFLVIKGDEETDNINKAVGLFLTDIVVSASWPFILFKYQIIPLSTISAVALLLIAIFMQKTFTKENKIAGNIVLIYIIWLSFSLYLNLGLLILN
ncbi:MAG TPA: tryptophan-rich sensory protein [Alphaproteobacteria bacterium]|nr:tryptophan-rich sensory protein [Alphaproteobacteria bacterium]